MFRLPVATVSVGNERWRVPKIRLSVSRGRAGLEHVQLNAAAKGLTDPTQATSLHSTCTNYNIDVRPT